MISSSLTLYLNCRVFHINICSFYVAFLVLSDVEASPSREKSFQSKSRPRVPVSVQLTCFAYISLLSSYLRKFDSAATEAPHSGENFFIQKPDSDFLLTLYLYTSHVARDWDVR
jgi:hypothetical protein